MCQDTRTVRYGNSSGVRVLGHYSRLYSGLSDEKPSGGLWLRGLSEPKSTATICYSDKFKIICWTKCSFSVHKYLQLASTGAVAAVACLMVRLMVHVEESTGQGPIRGRD